jgi:predicted DNA-binding transcriptional regulator AlpA
MDNTKDAYSIDEFCTRHGISRAKLYQEWEAGRGPRRMKVGSRTLISAEAGAAWRRNLEAETQREVA